VEQGHFEFVFPEHLQEYEHACRQEQRQKKKQYLFSFHIFSKKEAQVV
jgi:hypothetical protein